MKELSIEEKAKAYDEAISIAKSKIKDDKDHVLYEDDVIEIFPELKESEDEKTRKEIIDFVKSRGGFKGDWIAWLEKRGEQKSAEWSEEDRIWIDRACMLLNELNDLSNLTLAKIPSNVNEIIERLKSLKDRYTCKPSDEQIKVCKEVYADLLSAKGFALGTVNSELNRLEDELKKLKD